MWKGHRCRRLYGDIDFCFEAYQCIIQMSSGFIIHFSFVCVFYSIAGQLLCGWEVVGLSNRGVDTVCTPQQRYTLLLHAHAFSAVACC